MSSINWTTDKRYPGPKSRIRIARDKNTRLGWGYVSFRRVEIRGYKKNRVF